MSERQATVTRRVRISTGLDCNIRCPFCYYDEELNTQRYPFETITRMLDVAAEYGVRDVDFSGGEPTIRKDFPALVNHARELGFRQICVITNGTRIAQSSYLSTLVDAGLNEVLMSVHGVSSAIADRLSGRTNMAAKVGAALDNVTEAGLRLRTNTVVNRENLDELEEIAGYIATHRPAAANFICFNDWVNASAVTDQMAVKFSEAGPRLCRAVEILKGRVAKITVRYMPFCQMPGYETHICGLLKNTYDHDEWLDSMKRIVTDLDAPDRFRAYRDRLNEGFSTPPPTLDHGLTPRERDAVRALEGPDPFTTITPDNLLAAHVMDNALLRATYRKAAACAECSLADICDGVHRAYAEFIGTDELRPVSGRRPRHSLDWSDEP